MASERDSADHMVFISRGEGEERIERKIRKSQINTERLSVMFGLEKSSIHLVEEFGRDTEWANREGRFNLSAFPDGTSFQVEGSIKLGFGRSGSSPGPSSSSRSTNLPFSPIFRSVVPGKSANKKTMATYSLKVTRAEKEGLKIINATRQTYITLNESTANVPFITTQCREDFGEDTLQLVTANGLAVEDSESTRGLAFWKAASRKLFAVSVKSGRKRKQENADEIIALDEDNDNVSLSSAKSASLSATTHSDINLLDIKETVNMAVVEAIQKELNTNFFIVRAVQNSLIKEFMECFECVICKETAKPPVVVSSCCESVLGCEECVNRWISSGNSTCPKCRSKDDFIAINLKGFQILSRLNSSFTRTDHRAEQKID